MKQADIWHLRKGMDRRFRAGHPWVYSNELQAHPASVEPGSLVELRDASGKFLARGFGNLHSLISFRAVSREEAELEPTSQMGILKRLEKALQFRTRLGFSGHSYRLCYGEADQLPGLIIDYYKTPEAPVFVIQAHTAGAQKILSEVEGALEKLIPDFEKAFIVLRNDLSVRKLEGLSEELPRILKEGVGSFPSEIWVRSASQKKPLLFKLDLLKGQKTGFFLDQFANIELTLLRARSLPPKPRILDLCCYVGHWSAQVAQAMGECEVLAVDVSAQALAFAQTNIQNQGGTCEVWKADVLKDLSALPDQSFDLVIADPPSLISGRKHIPVGSHAYLQLMTQAFRLVKPSGFVVSCSCSALMEESVFVQILAKAALRSKRSIQWIGRGAQAPDHPMRAEFPEGRYLKAWIGQVD